MQLNFKTNPYSLLLYQGSHGDHFIKYCKLIFPTKLFLEKPAIFINNEGFVQNLQHFFFKYSFKTTKRDIDIFQLLMDLFKIQYNKDLNFNQNKAVFVELNKLTPIFSRIEAIYYLTNFKILMNFVLKSYLSNINLNSLINNFYLTNSLTRNSKVLTLCSNFFNIYNDFRYLFLINF